MAVQQHVLLRGGGGGGGGLPGRPTRAPGPACLVAMLNPGSHVLMGAGCVRAPGP